MTRGDGSNWVQLTEIGSCWLFKLAVTSWNLFLLIVETGCDYFKLVLSAWQDDGSNWLWLTETGSYLIVETGCD